MKKQTVNCIKRPVSGTRDSKQTGAEAVVEETRAEVVGGVWCGFLLLMERALRQQVPEAEPALTCLHDQRAGGMKGPPRCLSSLKVYIEERMTSLSQSNPQDFILL